MGYSEAMEAAGAKVELYEQFGSYQGDWWARVEYEGRRGWVTGSYGSCSGCDSFQAEFDDYGEDGKCATHRWMYDEELAAKTSAGCLECQQAKEFYDQRLAAFGKSYLDPLLTQEEAEERARTHASWSAEDKEMLDYLQKNKIEGDLVWMVEEEGEC